MKAKYIPLVLVLAVFSWGLAIKGAVAEITHIPGAIGMSVPVTGQVCYPASRWDGPRGEQPCTWVHDLRKDGSSELWLMGPMGPDPDRVVCKVPSPDSKGKRFKIRCKRKPLAPVRENWPPHWR